MNAKEIFEIAGAILACLGGGSAIVLSFSSWFGKVWANRILEKEKAEHSKDLEQYKRELSEELEKVKSLNDKALYVSKAQYDNEYKIYMEIWEKLHECVLHTLLLYPNYVNIPVDDKRLEDDFDDKYDNYAKTYNEFSITIDKYAPFYRKDLNDSFIFLRDLCSKQGHYYKIFIVDLNHCLVEMVKRNNSMPEEIYKEVYIDNPNELFRLENELSEKIREYLLNLQLI